MGLNQIWFTFKDVIWLFSKQHLHALSFSPVAPFMFIFLLSSLMCTFMSCLMPSMKRECICVFCAGTEHVEFKPSACQDVIRSFAWGWGQGSVGAARGRMLTTSWCNFYPAGTRTSLSVDQRCLREMDCWAFYTRLFAPSVKTPTLHFLSSLVSLLPDRPLVKTAVYFLFISHHKNIKI